MAKDSVKSRMESKEGISFSEFTYQLLQAYDFYQLFVKFGVTIQVNDGLSQLGGNDQWGNITAGLELIRKTTYSNGANPCFGITIPLITTSSGQKFGKSEGNAIWLDKNKLPVYDFYQV